jgi:hypothetical protein
MAGARYATRQCSTYDDPPTLSVVRLFVPAWAGPLGLAAGTAFLSQEPVSAGVSQRRNDEESADRRSRGRRGARAVRAGARRSVARRGVPGSHRLVASGAHVHRRRQGSGRRHNEQPPRGARVARLPRRAAVPRRRPDGGGHARHPALARPRRQVPRHRAGRHRARQPCARDRHHRSQRAAAALLCGRAGRGAHGGAAGGSEVVRLPRSRQVRRRRGRHPRRPPAPRDPRAVGRARQRHDLRGGAGGAHRDVAQRPAAPAHAGRHHGRRPCPRPGLHRQERPRDTRVHHPLGEGLEARPFVLLRHPSRSGKPRALRASRRPVCRWAATAQYDEDAMRARVPRRHRGPCTGQAVRQEGDP